MWKVGRIKIVQKIYKTLCKLMIVFMPVLWYSIIVQRAKTKTGGTKKMKLLQTEWAFIIAKLDEVARDKNQPAAERLQAIEILKKLKETPIG